MEQGLQIGRDIKLAGFDDDPIAELLPVSLTTIRLPVQPFAQAAYEAMLGLIASAETSPRQVIIDTELVVRNSTDFRSPQSYSVARSVSSKEQAASLEKARE